MCYTLLPSLFGHPSMVLVISPLLALMDDQVHQVSKLGITATSLGSTQTDVSSLLGQVLECKYQVVFVSPEFVQQRFRHKALMKVREYVVAVVVDEAHCVSKW